MRKESLLALLYEIDAAALQVMQDDVPPRGAILSCGWLHDKLKEAIEIVRQHTDWQPISSAPKDGTHILAWDGFSVYVAWWCVDAWEPWPPGSEQINSSLHGLTLWMPLPPAPKDKP